MQESEEKDKGGKRKLNQSASFMLPLQNQKNQWGVIQSPYNSLSTKILPP
jgi:hypothetical protein